MLCIHFTHTSTYYHTRTYYRSTYPTYSPRFELEKHGIGKMH